MYKILMQKTTITYQLLIAFLWSLFEATFFFIIPDIWLSFTSLESLKKGFKNIGFALLGALLGGVIMYIIGSYNISSLVTFLELIPDINSSRLLEVMESLKKEGLIAIFRGPIEGIPYKIYASYSGALGLNFLMFILISIPARAMRFVITVLITNLISKTVLRKRSLKSKKIILILIWIILNTIYFTSL